MGLVITPEGIIKDPSYVDKMRELRRPKNINELQRIVGFFNWCAKFVPYYARKVEPLYEITRKGKKWEWKLEYSALNQRKKKFVNK